MIHFTELSELYESNYINHTSVKVITPPTNLREGNVSVMSVCLFTGESQVGLHVTITHDVLYRVPWPTPTLTSDIGHLPPRFGPASPSHGTDTRWVLLNHVQWPQAGGAHPSGMLSCFEYIYLFNICESKDIARLNHFSKVQLFFVTEFCELRRVYLGKTQLKISEVWKINAM